MNAIEMIQACGAGQAKLADDYTAPPTMRGAEVADQGEYLQASDTGRDDAIRTTYVMGCEDVG